LDAKRDRVQSVPAFDQVELRLDYRVTPSGESLSAKMTLSPI